MIGTILDSFLLKEIELATTKKLIKKGRLVLYKEDLYYITLYIKNIKDEIKKLEIPKPFSLDEITNGKVAEFDYTLPTLTKSCKTKLESVNKLPRYKESKYYNTIITLRSV